MFTVPVSSKVIFHNPASQARRGKAMMPMIEWVPCRWPPEMVPMPAHTAFETGGSEWAIVAL